MSERKAEATTAEIAVGHGQEQIPAIRRILDAVSEIAGERAPDRREVMLAFARATLRRVPADLLRVARAELVAGQLVDAFEVVDERRADELSIRILSPDAGLDGSPDPGSTVQISSVDRAFLLGTVTDELTSSGYAVTRALHPIIGVERGSDGHIDQVVSARTATERESYLHIELDRRLDDVEAAELTNRLRRLVADVMAATGDFEAMRARVREVIDEVRATDPDHADPEHVSETAELLEWLLADNFILLGCREYEIIPLDGEEDTGRQAGRVRPGSGLGILADEDSSRFAEPMPLDEMRPELRERALSTELLVVSRTNRLSTVQRRTRMEYVGIRRYSADGAASGEFRVVGLFSRKGQAQPARTTPVLRRKLAQILEREDLVPGSHDEGTLINLFQAVPKDELFQSDVDQLHTTLVGLLHAEEHGVTRVLVRTDPFTRSVSVLVAVPRDRYGPRLREQLQELLLERFGGERVDVELSLGDRREALARFSIAVPGEIPEVDTAELQQTVRELARLWIDDLEALLVRRHGEVDGRRLLHDIGERLPGPYRDQVPVELAADDVGHLDRLLRTERDLMVVLQSTEGGTRTRLKAFKRGGALELSGFLPILESLGMTVSEELPYRLDGTEQVHVHDFGVRDDRAPAAGDTPMIEVEVHGARLAEATLAAWEGRCEIDSLNRLVLRAELGWRGVSILRAYRRYRRQVGTAFTPEYVNDALAGNPAVATALLDYFDASFDPDHVADDATPVAMRERVEAACDAVERLDHDRIMRSFLALVDATLRTNAFRDDATATSAEGVEVPYLAFKFDSAAVPQMPKPVPHREIFVYSPLVEGIHLRGGEVARGGLRWSDRQDDVRTEILSLVKAQILKNAVIVPTGAKGGFVLKAPATATEQLRAAVERQYVTFVRGLLDLTDDIEGDEVVAPPRVVRHDDDDPYLVVAADKGTARFSDVANRIATDYGFWLGDAFASGGSKGYDHKALGITARGAWVAVRRHFRELGVDTQADAINVVGIGDMSGDVFGNGMLSSRTIELVAAFDHRDIFIDPAPDPERSYAERRRLYELPGSSWQDYDRELIADGGGVFSRDAKRIELSDQVRELLRVDDAELSPPELIQAILCAPVDLLFAGGIGTYVKAAHETHAEIGDRINDELRVDASDVRARVFGEGANLSITQAGRIAYARRGGRINQDAVDNAAGVDISDHEVNVKILLRGAVEAGRIDQDERDQLLVEVTDDVVAHVLRDVELQTWQLSQAASHSVRRMYAYEQLMQRLEAEGVLDRAVEHLPDSATMTERAEAGAGLSRPELATLLAYAKRVLAEAVLGSELGDLELLVPLAQGYFPPRLVERFADLIGAHRLRRELIATLVANDVVNRVGITFAFRLAAENGAGLVDVVRAYWTAREVVGADRWWRDVEALLDVVGPARQLELKVEVDNLVSDLTRLYLNDPDRGDVAAMVDRDADAFAELVQALPSTGDADQRRATRKRIQGYLDDLLEPELATFLSCVRGLAMTPDINAVARSLDTSDRPLVTVADIFQRLGGVLLIDRLEGALAGVGAGRRWARWQRAGLLADLRRLRRDAAQVALTEIPAETAADALDRFVAVRRGRLEHAETLTGEIEQSESVELDAVAVAVRAVRAAIEHPAAADSPTTSQRVEGGTDVA